MITKQEYDRRVSENTKIFLEQQAVGLFSPPSYYAIDACPGEYSMIVACNKVNDILASVLLQKLAYVKETNGADGAEFVNGIMEGIEFKLSYRCLNRTTAFKTVNNSIYFTKSILGHDDWVPESTTTGAKSKFEAKFKASTVATWESKRRTTYFVTFEGESSKVICAYRMSGDNVMQLLGTSKSIKLGSFMRFGEEISTIIPAIGWDNWCSSKLPHLEVRRRSTPAKELARARRVSGKPRQQKISALKKRSLP
jgi:hypothetical protein